MLHTFLAYYIVVVSMKGMLYSMPYMIDVMMIPPPSPSYVKNVLKFLAISESKKIFNFYEFCDELRKKKIK